MKQQLISLFFCGVLLLQGCTEKKNEAQLEKTLSVYQVDLKSESPKESIDRFLAGMEIRLLPLESGDSILFKGSASTIHLADDDIFLLDASQRVIFRFGRDGKFKNNIFRNGQGPEEYNVLFNMALFDNKVYALDNTKIQLYDYEGNNTSGRYFCPCPGIPACLCTFPGSFSNMVLRILCDKCLCLLEQIFRQNSGNDRNTVFLDNLHIVPAFP